MTDQAAPRSCLIVLGMHRSGTSATTGVLHLLNVNLGTCLQEAQEGVNPKGFWEHAAIVEQHEKLLGSLDSGWWDVFPLPQGWQKQPAVLQYREQLIQIIQQEFSGSALWAIKDPRLCRLVPLWLDILAAINVNPHYLLVIRHPVEVAASLAHRDGFASPMAALLWLRNVLESERETRMQPRTVITFDALLSDWHKTISNVTREFGIPLPLEDTAIATQIKIFLEPQLRHHSAQIIDAAGDHLMTMAVEAYDAILANDSNRLDAISVRFDQETVRYAPWLKQINNLMLKLKASEAIAKASEAETEVQRNEVARIRSTPSWRVTAPLRTVANYIQTLRK